MAGSRERGRYGHASGLDLDRLRAELVTKAPADEPQEPVSQPLPVESAPGSGKRQRRVTRRLEARRARPE